jgi:hypothetical protein
LGEILSLLSTSMVPQLDHISIFIQGLLRLEQSYRQILSDVKHFRPPKDSPPPRVFVVRLPCQHDDLKYSTTRALLLDSTLPCRTVGPDYLWKEMKAIVSHGWKHGVIYLPADGGSDGSAGYVMRRYTVWIPSPWKLT